VARHERAFQRVSTHIAGAIMTKLLGSCGTDPAAGGLAGLSRSPLPPLLIILSGLVVLALPPGAGARLLANGSTGPDTDGDGLGDLQEQILGTAPDRADSDSDGYSDPEELSRKSDPVKSTSLPATSTASVSLCARAEGGWLVAGSLIYVRGGLAGKLYEFGGVYGSVKLPLNPAEYLSASSIRILPTAAAGDQLFLVETAIPSMLVNNLGAVSLYNMIRDTAIPGSPTSVSVLDLVDFSGVVMSIEPAPDYMQGGAGVIYRPLVPDGEIPGTWSSGQICFQRTTPVGVVGVTIVEEIDSADCESMDTYCSAGDCSASVGGSVLRADPGALAGG
jgi:hypothetical protein